MLIGRGGPDDLLYGDVPTTRFTSDKATPLDSGIVMVDYRVNDGHG